MDKNKIIQELVAHHQKQLKESEEALAGWLDPIGRHLKQVIKEHVRYYRKQVSFHKRALNFLEIAK